MNVVIIEDEFYTAEDLRSILTEIDPSINVLNVLTSIEDAVAYLNNAGGVDLIFSDIELEDGLSFEIFHQLSIATPVIFCTAYNHYALEAFKTHSIDYILKPFSKNTVSAALKKWNAMRREFAGAVIGEQFRQLQQLTKKTPASYLVTAGERILPVNSDHIALFYISNNYVFLRTFDGKEYCTGDKLETVETLFQPKFFRANRQFLVSRAAIKDVSHHLSRKLKVNLAFPFDQEILVGKLKAGSFLSWLQEH